MCGSAPARAASVKGDTLNFEFRGKSGIVHRVTVSDPALARSVRRCAGIRGQELFQWIDAAAGRHRVDSKCYIHPQVLEAYAAEQLLTLNGAVPAVVLRTLLRRRSRGSRQQVTRSITAG
jgi:DNA topoisomerase-1